MHRMPHQKVENIALKKKIRTVFGNRRRINHGGNQSKGAADKIADHKIFSSLSNLKIYDYPEMLGELTKKFETIAICGTHGKTTTTGILSHVLNNSIGCNYLIGDGTGDAKIGNTKFVALTYKYKFAKH